MRQKATGSRENKNVTSASYKWQICVRGDLSNTAVYFNLANLTFNFSWHPESPEPFDKWTNLWPFWTQLKERSSDWRDSS